FAHLEVSFAVVFCPETSTFAWSYFRGWLHKSKTTLKGDFGSMPLALPRARTPTFEPQIVPKGQTRFEGFDDKILSLYARGMTTRQIKQHLDEISHVEVSPRQIST